MRGLKYFAEYSNIDGQLGRIEIWVEGYAGAATEVVCGGDPLIIERNKQVSETYLGGIVPTFYKFQFVSAAGFSASSFSSENYGDVIIRHLRAGVLEFNAIVAPFVSFDEDLPATYSAFTLQAECGIKYLSNVKIDATLTEVRLIDLVTEAMALIPRVDSFPFKVVDNTKVFTTAGLVLDGLPFFDRLINKRTFEGLTWTEVLEHILANRCEIVLDAGAWWVRNLSELSELYSAPNITTNLVNYSASGVKGETIPYRPGITGTRLAGGQFGSLFSQKNIRISRQETARIEYVTNSNFKGPVINFLPQGWTAGPTGLSTVIDNAEGYLQIQGGVNSLELTAPDTAYIQSSPVFWEPTRGVIPGDKLFLKVISEFSLVDRLRLQIIATQASGEPQPLSFYLTSAGAWTTTPTIYFANGSNAGSAGNVELELTPPAPFREFGSSANYNVIIRLFRSEGSSLGHTRFREVSLTKDPVMQSVFDDFFTTKDFRADPNADRSNSEDVDTLIAPDTGFPYREGSIFISQGVAANAFTSAFDGVGVRKLYDDYLAVSYLSVTGKRLRTYDGEFYNELHFSDVVQIDQIFYRFYNFSENRRSKRIRCKVVELKYVDFSTLQKDTIKTETAKVIERVIQSNNLIPSDFNFNSAVDTSGKTLFGIRPDTRFTSTNVTSLFLRADVDDEEAGVEITPGAQAIGLTTPPPIVPGVSEIIATRQWANTVFQPLDADLTALAALNTVGVIRRTGAGAMATMAGTANRVVKWGAGGALVDGVIFDDGTRVGIGTTTPEGLINIAGGGGTSVLKFTRTNPIANAGIGAIAFGELAQNTAGITSFFASTTGAGDLRFHAGNSNANVYAVSERMRIRQDGIVLIGTTTSTGELLQVQGTVRIATIDNAAGNVLTWNSSTGTITRRTASEILTDIAAQPLDADLTAIAALSTTGTLRRTAANTWQLYTPAIADISGLSSALAAKQDLNTRLTALTTMTGTGVVQWNGTAFSAGNIAITQVTDLASTIDTLWILRDRDTVGPIDGVRQVRSIDYYQARMDFGFDKTLDVPYIFYDTGTKFLANYMNDDGVWFHVDQNGVQKRYLREGETTAAVPTLQEVSQAGSNSSIRLKFNGINYALETAIPNLQSVAAAGSNSSIRLSLNGVGYATLAEIGGGGGGSVGTLGQVLAQGNSTNGIDINLNGFGVIRTQQVGGQNEILFGNNANIQLAAVNTIRTNATNVFTNANIVSNVAAAEFNTAIQGTNYESIRLFSQGISAGIPVTSLNLFANFVDISGPTDPGSALGGAVVVRLRGTLLELGVNASSSVVVRPNSLSLGTNNAGNVLFNFHPTTFTNNQKYVFQYNSANNTMNMVPA